MPPEEKKPEPEEPPQPNGQPTIGELAAIKAELEEDKKAIAAAQAAITDRDKRITELQATVSVVTQAGETAAGELAQAKEAYAKATARYLAMVKAANPTIPGDIIAGQTIEDIDASLAKAQSIATAITANLAAQAKEAKVPAGAPTRGEISTEGLSPREKIAAGIHQKGGTS
jgi:chromosome segregation ATPase